MSAKKYIADRLEAQRVVPAHAPWEQRFQDPQFRRFDCAHHAGGIVYLPSFVSFGKFGSTSNTVRRVLQVFRKGL
ncbi:MAG: hypothetical protein RLZZ436_2079 [Planctomycetota bacterium]